MIYIYNDNYKVIIIKLYNYKIQLIIIINQ